MKSGRLKLQWSNITWIKVDRLKRAKRQELLDNKTPEVLPTPTPIPALQIVTHTLVNNNYTNQNTDDQ